MERLAEQLGVKSLSRSQVSEMAAHLDAQVKAFRERPLDAGPYTFVWADRLTVKVREDGRVVNVHALVATGVNADGHREILGLDVASAEDGAGWLAFWRGLVARGLLPPRHSADGCPRPTLHPCGAHPFTEKSGAPVEARTTVCSTNSKFEIIRGSGGLFQAGMSRGLVAFNTPGPAGPDPRRVHDLEGLARELGLLRARAAVGSRRQRITLAQLTSRIGLPASSKSTVHSYVTGQTLAPAETLDKIVIALGATPVEQREWSEAWYRVSASIRETRRRIPSENQKARETPAEAIVRVMHERLQKTVSRQMDICTISAQNMDLIRQVDLIAPDHEAEIGDALLCPGGSGANTTLALAMLGARAGVIGAVADDAYGRTLSDDLLAAGVDTSLLITIKRDRGTGYALIFTDADGRRLIYSHPGVNESLARELVHRKLQRHVLSLHERTRILHLSSFTSAAERELQQSVIANVDSNSIVSFSPGTLYSILGADRLGGILIRTNVLFVYEQQLDLLLAKSSGGGSRDQLTSVADKMARLFEWRHRRGSTEPLIIVSKRPVELARGQPRDYVAIGYGRENLEDQGGADTGTRRYHIVDSTGAGDALAAGFLLGLLNYRTPNECNNLAFVMALSVSSGLGAREALPRRDELAERWRRHLPDISAPDWLFGDSSV